MADETERASRRSGLRALAAGCAVLVAAGCGGSSSGGGTAPGGAAASAPPRASARALAARYLAIAQPANRRLDHDFDGQHDAERRGDLAAADADLRDAAATERLFDRQLIAVTFPPPVETFVRLLYQANQARAALTATAAAATSLRDLRGFQPRLDAANGPVEEAVRVIRDQLGLPPPDTS